MGRTEVVTLLTETERLKRLEELLETKVSFS
jgi:hypothetical protein